MQLTCQSADKLQAFCAVSSIAVSVISSFRVPLLIFYFTILFWKCVKAESRQEGSTSVLNRPRIILAAIRPPQKKSQRSWTFFFGMEWTAPRPLLCFFMDFVSAFQIFWLSELTDFFYDFPLFLFITKGNQKAALLIGNSFGTSFNEFLLARKLIAVARIIYFCIQKFRNRQQKWDFKKSLNFMSVLRTEKGLV